MRPAIELDQKEYYHEGKVKMELGKIFNSWDMPMRGSEVHLTEDNIKIEELVGKGGFGEVYKIQFEGKEYALK